jgi:hypothetical protein
LKRHNRNPLFCFVLLLAVFYEFGNLPFLCLSAPIGRIKETIQRQIGLQALNLRACGDVLPLRIRRI